MVKSQGRVQFFCVGGGEGGSSQKITTIKRERASEKIGKLRGGGGGRVMRFLNGTSQIISVMVSNNILYLLYLLYKAINDHIK